MFIKLIHYPKSIKVLLESLEHLHIYDAVWVPTRNNQYYQVYFTTDLDSNDYVIHYLNSMGIGERGNSTLGYMPFSLFYYNEVPSIKQHDYLK